MDEDYGTDHSRMSSLYGGNGTQSMRHPNAALTHRRICLRMCLRMKTFDIRSKFATLAEYL